MLCCPFWPGGFVASAMSSDGGDGDDDDDDDDDDGIEEGS
jgi:hypothetical protein